jgi:hypothetical protein
MRGAAKQRYGWQLGLEQLQAGVAVLEKERRKPNFGNAGAVNNLLSQVRRCWGQRPHHALACQATSTAWPCSPAHCPR